MDATAFNGLKPGNIIESGGQKRAVVSVLKNRDGSVQHVSLLPAINATDAEDYSVVSPDYTACCGETINPE